MDGHFVPNLTIGPPVVSSLRRHTDLFFDTHLMITDPARYLEAFRDAGADGCTVHVEVGETGGARPPDARPRPAGRTGRQSRTHPSMLSSRTSDLVDLVLCMTVFPGFGGQSFMAMSCPRCARSATAVDAAGLAVDVEVDGGIDEHTVVDAARSGANVFVAGSAVFGRAASLQAAEEILRAAREAVDGRLAVPTATRTWMRTGCTGRRAAPVEGRTSPNPWVGAVVVASDARGSAPLHFVGATAPAGGPHAEVTALAGPATGLGAATLYVTLEPCAHHGRTPPCVGAVVAVRCPPGGRGRDRPRPACRRRRDRRAAGSRDRQWMSGWGSRPCRISWPRT